MNKKILFLVLLGVLALPSLISAQLVSFGPPIDYRSLVYSITNVVGFIFGAVAVICFVMAGILFLSAQGQPEKLQAAKSALIWGVVGVIVGIIAFSIVGIVGSFLGGGGWGSGGGNGWNVNVDIQGDGWGVNGGVGGP